jgi:hypothetical protein
MWRASVLGALLLAMTVVGCQATSLSSAAGGGDGSGGELSVTPGGALSLGYFQEQVFLVTLTGADGSVLSGEPISVSLIGPAHNGFVSPFELTSDEEGQGEVLFTAPDTATQLEIRFSSPAATWDAVVEVEVDPEQLGFAIEVGYDGQRELDSVEAAIFEDITCADIALGAAGEPVETQSFDSIPAQFEFIGLHAGSTYAVRAIGFNAEHESRAEECADGLLPDGPGDNLILQDLPLDLVGVFEVSTAIDAGDTLLPVVDELASSLDPFSADVPDAILDAIREVIAGEPLIAESFDAIRAADDLDGALAEDFAIREVDVAASLASIWEQVDGGLTEVSLSAEFEIGAPSDGVHDLYHTIGFLSFDELDSNYFVTVPETGLAAAQPAENDLDLLLISEHQVGLGLGDPIHFLLDSELTSTYGTEGLAAALEAMVDCDAVVAVLSEPLSEVADTAEILAGCQNAMVGAETLLDDKTDWINAEYAQVSFESGSCRLADPGEGSVVETIDEGAFEVTWEGDAPLGPMVAQFEGHLQDL